MRCPSDRPGSDVPRAAARSAATAVLCAVLVSGLVHAVQAAEQQPWASLALDTSVWHATSPDPDLHLPVTMHMGARDEGGASMSIAIDIQSYADVEALVLTACPVSARVHECASMVVSGTPSMTRGRRRAALPLTPAMKLPATPLRTAVDFNHAFRSV